MIERIVPAGVVRVAELRTGESDGEASETALFPEEQRCIARARAARRHEFAAGRRCAHTALAALGVPPTPVLIGTGGAPAWPDTVVGSLTHCEGLRAAAVALAAQVHTIGIDAEPHLPLPATVLRTIARADDVLPADDGSVAWDRLLFCAKEAVFKAWYPLARRYLGFDEAQVRIAPDGTFTARLLVPGPRVDGVPVQVFAGRWTATPAHVAAAVVITR